MIYLKNVGNFKTEVHTLRYTYEYKQIFTYYVKKRNLCKLVV